MTKHTYSCNAQHLLRDGKPWLPAMGEFHFSRYPDAYWRESIRLMKAGGVDIVASYVIWLHHEPRRGEYDFTGSRNIRKFLTICAEEDMAVFLRIGPYVHGEVKHGGCPDWMDEVPGWRSTHPAFMECLRRYWTALYGEIRDHVGGCLLGLQFDNEYIWDGEGKGDEYIDALVSLADDIGIRAPIHTATKCKGQFSGHCIPAFGSYADAPWSGSMTKLPPNTCYLFSDVRDVDQLRNTILPEERRENWCTPIDIPFLCAEIGGGVQPTYDRRPAIHPRDVGALATVKLGSGVVLPDSICTTAVPIRATASRRTAPLATEPPSPS